MALADIPFALAQINSKAPQNVRIKSVVAQILYWHEGLTQEQIAKLLHTNQSNISRIMKNHNKRLRNDPLYKQLYYKYYKAYA